MITGPNFKDTAKENVKWHGLSFLVNDKKFNEKIMLPEILLENNVEIQNESNVFLTFCATGKINFNVTHWENCVLLNSGQEFIEIEAWLLLTFFLCLNNQSISLHSIVTY